MASMTLGHFLAVFMVLGDVNSVRHGRNLIWSMSPSRGSGVPRIVSIEGDPADWVPNGNVTVRHISAPHSGWQFRGLAFHYATQTLFWSERSNKRVQGLQLDGTTATRTLFAGTSKLIDGIVVDWISLNLYMADPKYNWIMMVSLNSSTSDPKYKLLIRSGLERPHGIAVYPQRGYLIWSDWGYAPKIEIANLMGQNRRHLVSTDLLHPRGLTIDYDTDTVYWVDSQKHTVESVDFKGNSRRILVSHPKAVFYGITVFEDFVFVTEQTEGHLRIYDKNTGKGYINYQLGYIPFGIVMYDNTTQLGDSSVCDALMCAHFCVNSPPLPPRCLCGDGYTLNSDQKTCSVKQEFIQPSHLYAVRDAICQYPANLGDMSLRNITLDRQCFLKTSKGFLALAFDSSDNMLFYSENVTKSISKVQLRKGSFTETVIRGVGEVKGLAYDWLSKTLYWTDNTYKWIGASSADGKYQTIIIEDNLVEPLGIVVHPKRSRLIWSDPGRKVIEMSAMNGGDRIVLPITLIDHPNHIYMDYKTDIMYWADSGLNQVMSYHLDTGKIEVIYRQQNSNFYGISIFQDFLIWTDQGDMNGIHVTDIVKKTKIRGILHPQTGVALDVISYDSYAQPQLSFPCDSNDCDQLCLGISNTSYVCACGTGYTLDDTNLRTCASKPVTNKFLLVADGYQKHLYQVNMDVWEINSVATNAQLLRPIAIGYDPVQQKVFWTENKMKSIGSASLNMGDIDIISQFGEESVLDGLVVDHVNRLLFYTDTGLNKIKVISLINTKLQKTIVEDFLDEPRAITVHPQQGKIYWTDWGADPKIECANMDGSERMVLVNLTVNTWPNGITIDYKAKVLYWVEAKENVIEAINLNGTNRRTIIQENKAHYFGITLMGDYIYVTDWTSRYIKRIPKKGGKMEEVGEPKFSRLNGIISYDRIESFVGQSPCFTHRCQHFCLPKPNFQYVCACADGYLLHGKKCIRIGFNDTEEGTLDTDNSSDNIVVSDPTSSEQRSIQKQVGLSTAGIVAVTVVTVVILTVAGVASIFLYRRWRAQFIPHDRLVEDRKTNNFYRISFPEDKETVSFDSGIENPFYDHIHSKS